MASNTISQIYKSSERHFTKDLRQAKNLDETRLHRVRVDIKNIRVLLELLTVLTGSRKKAKPMLRHTNPVFRKAGVIRSASLSLKLTEPYRSQVIRKFRQHLKLRRQDAGTEFVKTLKEFDFDKFSKHHRKVTREFEKLKNKQVRRVAGEHIRQLLARVRADVFDISDDEKLHEIRKRLKVIRNLGQLVLKMDPDFELRMELEKINAIYDRIGQWHDTQELILALENYVDDLSDPEALEKAAPLIITLKKKCLFSKRLIERRLKGVLLAGGY